VATDGETFRRMVREFPVRTLIFTVGLPAFALVQVVNGVVYGGVLPLIGLFAFVTVAFSVQLTRYHVAAYRRNRLARRWVERE